MARRMRCWAVATVSAALLGLALVLFLAWPQPATAGGGCVDTYTVRRGDILSQIAQRFGLPMRKLWDANRDRIANPDLIYVGQVLCLPVDEGLAQAPASMPLATANSLAVLEGSYRYTPSAEEDKLALPRSGDLGKRIELPLEPVQPVTVFTTTGEVTRALASGLTPLLVGLRNRDVAGKSAITYTLVAIGSSELLGRLAISETLTITPSTAPAQARPVLAFLRQPGMQAAAVLFWLEAENGARMPFNVSHLDVVADLAQFNRLYLDHRPGDPEAQVRADDIGFVLFAAAGGRYHMMLRLSPEGYGPPGWTTAERCASWRHRPGRWFWFFRYWYRCPG